MKNIDGNIVFEQHPHIASYASAVGKKEGEGSLSRYFDHIIGDSYAGRDTFEQAESEMTSIAVQTAMEKGGFKAEDMDIACCGDLLNQCVASSFAMRSYGIPYAGIYGACSTMALSMILASIAVESGAVRRAVCAASSHYCTAERQYRFPLEYGSQRPPTAQWTVTGAGACIIEKERMRYSSVTSAKIDPLKDTALSFGIPQIISARIGKIVDYGITDQNNMGAAMAPAVVKVGTVFSNMILCIRNAVSDFRQKRYCYMRILFQIAVGRIIENFTVLIKTGAMTGAVPRVFCAIVLECASEMRTALL